MAPVFLFSVLSMAQMLLLLLAIIDRSLQIEIIAVDTELDGRLLLLFNKYVNSLGLGVGTCFQY